MFNLVSTILLMPILYEYFTLPLEFIFTTSLTYQITGSLLSIAGVYILIDGFKNYRTDEFVGIYQIKNHHEFHPSKLSRSGWNGVVRHPLYFGGIVLIIGLLLISPSIKLGVTGLLAIAYLYVGTLWEEKKLISEFGSTYKDYKTEVSMLFPIKWVRNKLS
jgi:protein-S-isoprenylcysteine O-methyltransferase Ste14